MEAFKKENQKVAVFEFSDVGEMWSSWKKKRFDVLFCDIEMPGMNGIEFGRFLLAQNCHPCLVYISAHEEHVFDAFAARPLRFLRKDHIEQELTETVQAILKYISENKKKSIVIDDKKAIHSIKTDDILYVECLAKVQRIVMVSSVIEVRLTLSELKEKMEPLGFLQPHKGYLVNYQAILQIEDHNIQLKNGLQIPLSKYRRGEIKQQFLRLMTENLNVFPNIPEGK